MYNKILYYPHRRKSCEVVLSKFAQNQAKKLPKHIRHALEVWIDLIESDGVLAMRGIRGYHDEPLKGKRMKQRSSRLSHSYRVIYEERENSTVILFWVIEVNKHDY